MAEELFPVFDVPDMEDADSDEYDTEYKRSMKWDVEKGDFVLDGSHRMVECDGREAYMIWCLKVAQTERYACLAYPDEIGVEMEDALDDEDEATVESMVQRTITDALTVNPRTEYVGDFVFDWDGDELHCSFEVKGIDWDDTIKITI